MNFVPSIPAFSKIFILPDESRIIPVQAIRDKVKEGNEIAVDARTCLVNDSRIVGDLELTHRFLRGSRPSIQFLYITS